MHYKRDIKEEEKGAEHYERHAKRDTKHAKTFKSMARDEEKHEAKLKKMDMAKRMGKGGLERFKGMKLQPCKTCGSTKVHTHE